jgi:hypothetical protein
MEPAFRQRVVDLARARDIPVFEVCPSHEDQVELEVKPTGVP